MNKRSTVTSIDVGTTKICTTIAEIDDNMGARIIGVGVTPSHGLHKGLVVNIKDAREAIRDSVRKAEQACNYKVESAFVGVTGRHVDSVNNRGVVAITRNDRLVRPDDLRRVLNSAQSINVPNDRRLPACYPARLCSRRAGGCQESGRHARLQAGRGNTHHYSGGNIHPEPGQMHPWHRYRH